MAAAVAASQGANTGGGNHEHHERSDKAALLEHEDPVLARTITVDESFRRMEVTYITRLISGYIIRRGLALYI